MECEIHVDRVQFKHSNIWDVFLDEQDPDVV